MVVASLEDNAPGNECFDGLYLYRCSGKAKAIRFLAAKCTGELLSRFTSQSKIQGQQLMSLPAGERSGHSQSEMPPGEREVSLSYNL